MPISIKINHHLDCFVIQFLKGENISPQKSEKNRDTGNILFFAKIFGFDF